MSLLTRKYRLAPAMAWAEIDLQAVKYNFDMIKRIIGRSTKVLCVIKADAYGHGSISIARVLEKKGVDMLGISDLREGMALRKAGIRAPILMIENTLAAHAKYLVEYKITPVVCTYDLARALDALGSERRQKISIHIKIDTGMGRLGVSVSDALSFVRDLSRFSWLNVEGLCTHFPLADKNRIFTLRQQRKFLSIAEDLQEATGLRFSYIHAANSAGIAAYPLTGFTMVRAGLMLYGMYPSPRIRAAASLKPVMSVKSRITFLKQVPQGFGISYGHQFVTRRKMTIATIAIGYSDGYLRAFSNKAYVLIRGQRCRVLGAITMDQIMVDVSRLKNVRVGDVVCILGRQGSRQISAEELAYLAGTINYEVTCLLGAKLDKILVS